MLTAIQVFILVWFILGVISFGLDPFTRNSHIKDIRGRKTITLGYLIKWVINSAILIILGGFTFVVTLIEICNKVGLTSKVSNIVIWRR